MRQPEVARLARLLLALVLVLPLLDAGRSMVVAGLFLAEFLGHDAQPLSRLTSAPSRSAIAVPSASVDRYVQPRRRGVPLVLVHGLAPDGKDDVRVSAAAALLARAGFDVAVPTIPGLTRLRLRPADRDPVLATIAARSGPTVVVGVSVGAGVAVLAASDPAVRDRIPLVLSLGGYGSAIDLVRYYLTGEYRGPDGAVRRRTHDPALIQAFVDANRDLLDPSAQRALGATEPGDVAHALSRLSPEIAGLFDSVSPSRVVRDLRGTLILVHGRDDPAVPYTESIALATARPTRSRLVLVGVVDHVEPSARIAMASAVRDLAAMWTVAYALISHA